MSVSFYGSDYPDVVDPEESGPTRAIQLRSADTYPVRRPRWLWEGRIAVGTFALLAGREGLGKSTLAYWVAARVSRGELPGEHLGQPRAVLVCATEDSWSHTIVPRLIAAGADLTRIFNVEVETMQGPQPLSLPVDVAGVCSAGREVGAVLMLLDPLMSRLSSKLDTHRDQEVRLALEPLARLGEMAGMAVLGLIHLNKGGSNDPLNSVMGSKAFTAVARSVSVVVPDPEDEDDRRRLFGTPKNNIGRTDLPMLSFTIGSAAVESEDGTVHTGRVVWGEEVEGTVRDAMARAGQDPDARSAVTEAGDWLEDWLRLQGGEALSKDAKVAGKREGHSEESLKRALKRRPTLGFRSQGTPRQTMWHLVVVPPRRHAPQPSGVAHAGGDDLTDLTDPTGADLQEREQADPTSRVSRVSRNTPSREADPTDPYADLPHTGDLFEPDHEEDW